MSVGYPLGDVLALAMLLRLLAAPGRRPRAVDALTTGIVCLLITDVFYGLARLDSAWQVGGPIELGWVVFYAALGLAALMSSMRRLTDETVAVDPAADQAGGRRVLYLIVASLIAPAVLYVEWLRDELVDVPVIAAAAAIMFLLVVARVDGLIDAQRMAGARERALREAGAMLTSAATVADVREALTAATATLMPSVDYELHIENRPAGPGDAYRPLDLVPVTELPPDVTVRHGGPVLHALIMLPADPPRIGAFVLGGPEHTLRQVQPAFEALFQQILVVNERIRLGSEINRRDSEAYFRTLIQSASDVILIIDDEDRIRYASPSADTVFGRPDLDG